MPGTVAGGFPRRNRQKRKFRDPVRRIPGGTRLVDSAASKWTGAPRHAACFVYGRPQSAAEEGEVMRRTHIVVGIAIVLMGSLVLAQGGQTAPQKSAQAAAGKTVPPTTLQTLQTLLPVVADWTRAPAGGQHILISDLCSYTFADAKYTKDGMTVTLTVATAGGPESLMALAPLVATLPDDYEGQVDQRTIKRYKIGEAQAGEMWDAKASAGELTLVFANRFVVKAEGTTANLATLRAFVDKVDAVKLAEVKDKL
jgi:hypothetical protein